MTTLSVVSALAEPAAPRPHTIDTAEHTTEKRRRNFMGFLLRKGRNVWIPTAKR
jgi:hypothetical protein